MTRKRLTLLVALVLCLAASLPAASQSGGGYDLTWFTVDGGGVGAGLPSPYSLDGTIGQADAGTLGGGGYTLDGGFWGAGGPSGGPPAYNIYLPIVLRQS